MIHFEEKLVGQSVTQINFVQDYLQIVFSSKMTLTINNDFTYSRGQLTDFIDATVLGAITSDEEFILQFSDDRILLVGLADKNYHCPEVMVMVDESGEIIVWQ